MADILDDLSDVLDEAQLSALRERLSAGDAATAAAARAQRDLGLVRDQSLAATYPRAARAIQLGHLDLGDAVGEEAVKARLEAEEKKLTDLGVPIPGSSIPTPQSADPTDALGALAGGAAAPPQRDLVREFLECQAGNTEQDRERAATILVEMNRAGMKEEILDLADRVGGRPIIPRGI